VDIGPGLFLSTTQTRLRAKTLGSELWFRAIQSGSGIGASGSEGKTRRRGRANRTSPAHVVLHTWHLPLRSRLSTPAVDWFRILCRSTYWLRSLLWYTTVGHRFHKASSLDRTLHNRRCVQRNTRRRQFSACTPRRCCSTVHFRPCFSDSPIGRSTWGIEQKGMRFPATQTWLWWSRWGLVFVISWCCRTSWEELLVCVGMQTGGDCHRSVQNNKKHEEGIRSVHFLCSFFFVKLQFTAV